MVDVRRDVLRPPHGTTPAAVKSNKTSEMRSFKSNENIHKKEGGSYYVVFLVIYMHWLKNIFIHLMDIIHSDLQFWVILVVKYFFSISKQ